MTARADLIDEINRLLTQNLGWPTHKSAEAVVAWLERQGKLRAAVPGDAELDDLQQELRSGVISCGMHDDNSTELFDVEGAGDTMFVAADAITALRQQLAAVQADRTECCLQSLASMGQASEAYAAQLQAEAERDALRAALAHIRKQWPDSFAARHANAALNTGATK
tara:strand:- start:187 stop:687 length:501 start_codon:yes stop_codon:yes gene_type:complete